MTSFAFVFPGQGSQVVGMLAGWENHPEVVRTLAEAKDSLNEDIGALIEQGPADTLAQTTNTQPAMLVAGIAAYRVWMAEVGKAPSVMAGHSLGEYTALVAAGALSLTQALPLVRFRAQAMQQAVPVGQGGMAAILGLPSQQVQAICKDCQTECGEVVQAVNFNDPMQTVIAGKRAAVDLAIAKLKEAGAKRALPLPVSAPFHCELMKPAADRLREQLEKTTFQMPNIPVIHNISVAYAGDAASIREALYRQAFGAVRWVECVEVIAKTGVSAVVECGPGKVLSGMTARIDNRLQTAQVNNLVSLAATRDLLCSVTTA